MVTKEQHLLKVQSMIYRCKTEYQLVNAIRWVNLLLVKLRNENQILFRTVLQHADRSVAVQKYRLNIKLQQSINNVYGNVN